MSWQPAAETLIGRLTGPANTVVDLADCLRLTSAVLAALTRNASGADGLLSTQPSGTSTPPAPTSLTSRERRGPARPRRWNCTTLPRPTHLRCPAAF